MAQSCPVNANSIITTNPNTAYPSIDANLNAGDNTITLGPAGYGSNPIQTGDILLIIQMQGAEINSANSRRYGDGVSGSPASGYLNNSGLIAGNMEYIVSTNSVPLTGGTLNLLNGLANSYQNADYVTTGQYRYQIIRINVFYNLTLNSAITAPGWNGTTGGIIALSVSNTLNLNGQVITAAAAGFRGGGGRQLTGASGGDNTDQRSLSSKNFNGSKGEGIAGTPRFLNNQGNLLDKGALLEGYPNGSYGSGAPGNAGGGGTDGNPASNDQNAGGGGGGNGSDGGKGGNSWSSNLATGGEPGGRFIQSSPSRIVMGGGGGAGTTNNGTGSGSPGFSSSGAAGGGIVIIMASHIIGTGTINVNGANANSSVLNDSNGGGGAGGTVLIYSSSGHSNLIVTANGGSGGSNTGTGSPHGPGGGGGGGVIYSNAPLNGASTYSAGAAGVTHGNINYGASMGGSGAIIEDITVDQIPDQMLYCSVLNSGILTARLAIRYGKIEIIWEATNETNVTGYTIERSNNGNSFTSAETIQVKQMTGSVNHYRFTDLKTSNENQVLYYRLKQNLSNGSFAYSKIMHTPINNMADFGLKVRHNNAGGINSIRFMSTENSMATLQLFAATGAVAWQKTIQTKAGVNELWLNDIGALAGGVYRLVYTNKRKKEVAAVIIAH